MFLFSQFQAKWLICPLECECVVDGEQTCSEEVFFQGHP